MSDFDFTTLITDRSKSDVDAVSALLTKITNGTATEAEIAQFNAAAMKGAYNYTDLNRVSSAVYYLDEVLRGYGYVTGVQKIVVPHETIPQNYDENTVFLIHGESIEDSSYQKVPIENAGVSVSTAQSKFGGSSLYFNGASRLLIPQSTIQFGASDFTVDWWEYCETGAATRFCSLYGGTSDYGGLLLGYSGTQVYCSSGVSGAWDLVGGVAMFSVTSGAWVHWAVVRQGNVLKSYRNGTLFASTSITGAIAYNAAYKMAIGDYRSGDPSYFKGYIDEFRISNIARWTENFAPPDSPYETGDPLEPMDDYTWYEPDVPTVSLMAQYLANVFAIYNTILTEPELPEKMADLTVEGANQIEQTLLIVKEAIDRVAAGFSRSDAFSFWSGNRPFPTASSDRGRTWAELDAMETTWANWQVANWYLLLYGNLEAEGVVE